MAKKQLTASEFFDIVAPIAIYHWADVCYKEKALAAIAKIMDPIHDAIAETPIPQFIVEDRQEFNEELLEKLAEWAKEDYDRLMTEIVQEHASEMVFGYDYWGAKSFHWPENRNNKSYDFAGDADGRFPWYEKAANLISRLEELKRDREEKDDDGE